MSDSHSATQGSGQASREETLAALFASLVMQQTNMALMFLGHAPNPETGERVRNLDAARMFIDQLEMIEAKTKGNLSKPEEQLLTQSLTNLRLAFVEAVEAGPSTAAAAPSGEPSQPQTKPSSEPSSPASADEEHRKKFSKKY